jgi:hypothetical protein
MVERLELTANRDAPSVISAVGTLSNAVVSEEINHIFASGDSPKSFDEIPEAAAEQEDSSQPYSKPESELNDETRADGDESEVDFNDFFAGDFGQKEADSSHNKPSITGFKVE